MLRLTVCVTSFELSPPGSTPVHPAATRRGLSRLETATATLHFIIEVLLSSVDDGNGAKDGTKKRFRRGALLSHGGMTDVRHHDPSKRAAADITPRLRVTITYASSHSEVVSQNRKHLQWVKQPHSRCRGMDRAKTRQQAI